MLISSEKRFWELPRTAHTAFQDPVWYGATFNQSSSSKYPPPHPFTPDLYLLGVWGGVQGAAVVLGVHHGHVRAAVVQYLLHAVHTAALAARADRGAGDGVVAAQAVHLTAGCLAVLQVNIHVFIKTCFHK